MSNRREFIMIASVVGSAALLARTATAQASNLSDTDPTAVALGYKADGNKADKAKYPKYAAGQQCNSCSLYVGKPADTTGGCPLFAGKQVAAKGWCSAWVKKA